METQFRRNVSRTKNVNSNAPGRLAAILFQINLCRTVSGLSPLFLEQMHIALQIFKIFKVVKMKKDCPVFNL